MLDCAVLVISGSEGVQAHTTTLWGHSCASTTFPTFIFVTKMDLVGSDKNAVMRDVTLSLGSGAVDFDSPERDEHIALLDDSLLDCFLAGESITKEQTARLVGECKLFPCFFGSGLKLDGVRELLEAIDLYCAEKQYQTEVSAADFAAKVYKIGHDTTGNRLTYMKITGGTLVNRQNITYTVNEEEITEKVSGIRLYSGAKFEAVDSVSAGEICVVTGLSKTYAGEGLGREKSESRPSLIPVLSYRIKLPKEVSPVTFLPKLRELEEEEPLLGIVWNERLRRNRRAHHGTGADGNSRALISDRFGVDVEFEDGRIMYLETVSDSAEGVGHFEPLRHYAEVHLMLEPGERGSGLVFASDCSENLLDINWQRLILTHLEEKTHLGVMTGSPITDMKITLVSGRAHLKHTQGGDFREATYRALRQGLMTLRERGKPYCSSRIIPSHWSCRESMSVARYQTSPQNTVR